MTSPDIPTIASGLSEAERDALLGKFSFGSIVEQETGEAKLYQLGLWARGYGPREHIVTPLGLAVRNHLKEQTNG